MITKSGKKNEFQNFQLYENDAPTVKGEPFQPAAVWSTLEAMLLVTRPEEDGQWQQFNASQKIAWKTGTSYGFRDAWAIGLTPKICCGCLGR